MINGIKWIPSKNERKDSQEAEGVTTKLILNKRGDKSVLGSGYGVELYLQ